MVNITQGWIPAITVSVITAAVEVTIMKWINLNYPKADSTTVVWLYRLISIITISTWVLYRILANKDDDKIAYTLNSKAIIGWSVILGILAAITILSYYGAVYAHPNPSVPTAVRNLYFVLLFIFGLFFLGYKLSHYGWQFYLGILLMIVAVILLGVYGNGKKGAVPAF